ncbi:DUF3231 family protein [Oceanobacillus bengalensis]|uniref:DUF3231 family protein n=1 Tax=Oceanobacillus bengalensis TaxID=1435466 RepID=A0A494YUL6_9BACI|nr:DUF3231 family protein [Oceanobacillus bengalensis]RKQ13795.1 DUF3231 family protein [Oceanobacillus bengalensis]
MHIKKALTASELAEVWGKYMNDSITIAVLGYFINKAEDAEIKGLIKDILETLKKLQEGTERFLKEEKHPIPQGFTEADVNLEAPRLFTDNYMLQNCIQLTTLAMNSATMAIAMSTREDIYDYFSQTFREYNTFHKEASMIAKMKGVLSEPPSIPAQTEVDFVKKQNFLTGWFGERRPLLAVEIANLYSNIQRNVLGATTLIGFSQVAKSKEVRNFLLRGIEIAKKHVNIFSEVLEGNDIPVPMGADSMVTDSNGVSPFSDKLMMFHATGMITLGIGFYGLSISTNTRRDIAANYTRLTGEILLYSEDGANILIKNGWMEEPPRMVDREELAKTKGGK